MAAKKYPLGIQTFSEIVNGNYFYADKTSIVYQLAHYAKFHFLSRPRRFGKSLFVSTLQSYFEGRKELFKGLAIDSLEKEWMAFPVVHFDLSCGKYYNLENTHTILNGILQIEERKYGIDVKPEESKAYGTRLKNILIAATEQSGRQAVAERRTFAEQHTQHNARLLQPLETAGGQPALRLHHGNLQIQPAEHL